MGAIFVMSVWKGKREKKDGRKIHRCKGDTVDIKDKEKEGFPMELIWHGFC